MPRKQVRRYRAGETARLRPLYPNSLEVKVTAPNGTVETIPAPRGYADVKLTRAGEWTYEFSGEESVTFTVERAPAGPPPPVGIIEAG